MHQNARNEVSRGVAKPFFRFSSSISNFREFSNFQRFQQRYFDCLWSFQCQVAYQNAPKIAENTLVQLLLRVFRTLRILRAPANK